MVVAMTVLCAAVVILGSHGAHPSNSRELEPIVLIERSR
jgi:hypothetical protein